MEKKALHNFLVIDVSENRAGAYCGKLLAGYGAEVIKVEPSCGTSPLREGGPFCHDRKDPETSIPFLWLNTGKKSITLDFENHDGMGVLKQLIRKADVLLVDLGPGKERELGLTYDVLQEINPRLVVCSLSSFGSKGPYLDYVAEEIQIQALSGMMSMTGETDREPLAAGPSICHYTAGLHAYTGVLMALYQRNEDGVGQQVEISMLESSLENIEIALTTYLHTGKVSKRGPHPGVPWRSFECRDGYCVVIAMPARNWSKSADIFDDPFLFQEEYKHILGRIADRLTYEEALQAQVIKFEKEELFRAGQEKGLAFGMVVNLAEAAELQQHRDRNFFTSIDHPASGNLPYCGTPFKMSQSPWIASRAPLMGEHNNTVYEEKLELSRAEIVDLQQRGIV
ncbi:MAG: CoA transferase [Desulfobulbaceae bacterium]|nr:CoA transferase [Desulfobulbaceae bacterium]